MLQVSLSREFHVFAHEQLERVQRERHARALRAARHGLAQSHTPPSDADAISIPDVPSPDSGRPPLPPAGGLGFRVACPAQHLANVCSSWALLWKLCHR